MVEMELRVRVRVRMGDGFSRDEINDLRSKIPILTMDI